MSVAEVAGSIALPRLVLRCVAAGFLLMATLPPAQAVPTPIEQLLVSRGRATNFARIYAERLNGGLGVYRTASCMHQRDGGECLIRVDDEGFLFRFPGGTPGWQQLGESPTVETELLIDPDGRALVELIYNGSPR
jgi:hypothetical protein